MARGADPCGPLRTALRPWIKTDASVIAAFAGKPVKVFGRLPPVNAAMPYVAIARLTWHPINADCLSAGEVEYQIDVWSLTDPPGYEEAEAIAPPVAVAVAAMADEDSPAFDVPGWVVKHVQPLDTDYLDDPSDGKTVHAIIRGRVTLAPI